MQKVIRELKTLLNQKIEWLNQIGYEEKPVQNMRYYRNDINDFISRSKVEINKSLKTIAWNQLQDITDYPSEFKISKLLNNDEIKNEFLEWGYQNEIKKNLIYSFWKKKDEAIYIGRSIQGIKRPAQHITQYWLSQSSFIEIYPVKNIRDISRAECLATHIFDPERNINKPSHKAYNSHCIVCQQIRIFQNEMKKILS